MRTVLSRCCNKLLLAAVVFCLSAPLVNAQLNYSYALLTTPYSANSGGTVIVPASTDDGTSTVQNIGFSFSYNCNTYTQFMVSSNGWMVLGNGMTSSLYTNALGTTGQGPILAPLWDDMATASTGNVNYVLSGAAPNRVLTIEWVNMLWNYAASGPVMSYEVKLYETSNIVDFVYFRVPSGSINSGSASIGISSGTSATDFYSVDAALAGATYGVETNNINVRPTGNRTCRWTPVNMAFTSSTTVQASTATISKCSMNQPVLGVQVVTSGCTSPMSVTQFQVNMTGSTIPGTSTNDVTAIHIYYTGTSSAFSAVNEFVIGGTTPAAGTITINGAQTLTAGTNYFWIAYDINGVSATVGNLLDGQCTKLTAGGVARTPTVTNPAGTRTIGVCTGAPGGIATGMAFWVKTTAGTSTTVDGTALATWSDQSGNSRNAVAPTGPNSPTYHDNSANNINFNPVVDFNDAAQNPANASYMDIASNGILTPGDNPYTVYAVIKPGADNLITPGKFLFSGASGINNFNAFDVRSGNAFNDSWDLDDLRINNTWTVNYPSLATFNYNASQREMFIAGGSVGTVAGTGRTSSDLNSALGCQRATAPIIEFYQGSIAEIVTYPGVSHSTATRNEIESYLGIKYGVTLLHNYLSGTGTTVWDLAKDPAYNTNITGIARDDNSALSQKQSKSTSVTQDMLTVYIGPSKTANQAANTGSFTAGDKSFFIAANNNAPYMYSGGTGSEKPPGICCRLQREWLSQQSNFTNTDLKLEFDFSVITPGYTSLNTANLRLLVDADGDFTNATILNTPTITINVATSVVTITVPASSLLATPYFTLASVSTATLLPVQLSGFKGACKNNVVQLDWTKESGSDNSFTVERGSDGSNFSPIGTLQSNTPAPQAYTWSDPSPLAGNSYYRLKITPVDGPVVYSAVVNVSGCSHDNLQVATDPVTGLSTLLVQLQQDAKVDISLNDMLGRQLDLSGLTGHHVLQQGYYRLPVTGGILARGVYVLTVSVNGNRNVFRVIQP